MGTLYVFAKALQTVKSAWSAANHTGAHFMAVHAIPVSWNTFVNVNGKAIICNTVYMCLKARNASANIKTTDAYINWQYQQYLCKRR